MESKRKATAMASSPESEERATKRIRTPDSSSKHETTKATTEKGLRLIEGMREAKSKQGEYIAQHFETLPPKREFPDYYEQINMPLALDGISKKLRKGGYPNLTTLESDLKRMIVNAKTYNRRDSEVFEDAERIRKFVFTWMKGENPAYRDPGYAAFPTPLPGEEAPNGPSSKQKDHGRSRSKDASVAGDEPRQSLKIKMRHSVRPSDHPSDRETEAETPSTSRSKRARTGDKIPKISSNSSSRYAGKSFQEVQEIIVDEMLDLQNENGDNISATFHSLPSRKLIDYYKLITKPMALNILKKKVVGQIGKGEFTGKSAFSTWDDFERDTSLIWNNAKKYNEDASEIFQLAQRLEEFFEDRVAEAKKSVSTPAGDTLRLKLKPPSQPNKIKLKFGGNRDSAPATTVDEKKERPSTPKATEKAAGVAIDGEALQRQQEVVQAGTKGSPSKTDAAQRSPSRPAQPRGDSEVAAKPPSSMTNGQTSQGKELPTLTNGDLSLPKSNSAVAVNGDQPVGLTTDGIRVDSVPSAVLTNSDQGLTPHLANQLPRAPLPPPVPLRNHRTIQAANGKPIEIDSPYRLSGQDRSNALLKEFRIKTHPALPDARTYERKILPHNRRREQHIIETVDADAYYVQLLPVINDGVLERHLNMFVTVNGQRVGPSNHHGTYTEPLRPVYDVFLTQGIVNRVEVEMCTFPAKEREAHEFDFERLFLYIQVRRDS